MTAISIIGSILVLSGVWFYGKKSALGPLFSLCGCLLWIWVGIVEGNYPLAALNVILLLLNAYNFGEWVNGDIHTVFQDTRSEEKSNVTSTAEFLRNRRAH